MMAKVNTFFCNCGRTIGRPKDEPSERTGWGIVPWHAVLGQAKLHGIKCGSCRLNWLFTPSIGGKFAEVEQCCADDRCSCRYEAQEEE
jgi:hypothetical protein